MKKNNTIYTNYKPSQLATKKAKLILTDLLVDAKKPKVCLHCHESNFGFDVINEYFICLNQKCNNKKIIYEPLHGCRLNYAKIELFLAMIIDMQQIEIIYHTIKLSKPVIKKWMSRFLEQINWTKYKLDKDMLDVREIYGTIEWFLI